VTHPTETPDKQERANYDFSMLKRVFISVMVGIAAAGTSLIMKHGVVKLPTDFVWSVFAARDMLDGRDPYAAESSASMIPYPLTAALIGLPFSKLQTALAASAFLGISSAPLAFGLLRDGQRWRLLAFLSAPFYAAVKGVQ
jgi:hypothetical protein